MTKELMPLEELDMLEEKHRIYMDEEEHRLMTTARAAHRLQEELERLRNCVPGNVGEAVCKYFQSAIYGAHFGDYSRAENDEKELLALIGSLIERKREDLEEAYVEGARAYKHGMDVERYKVEYADRKMKDCPHAAPFKYCAVCKVALCPIGLTGSEQSKD